MLRALALVCTFLGFGFVLLGNGLAQVGAMCCDVSSTHHGTPIKNSRVLHDGEKDGAPIWYYDVKLVVASSTLMLVKEGRKWYVVQKDREVRIFDTWETCKTHVHGYRGSKFKSFRNVNDAHTYLQWKN